MAVQGDYTSKHRLHDDSLRKHVEGTDIDGLSLEKRGQVDKKIC